MTLHCRVYRVDSFGNPIFSCTVNAQVDRKSESLVRLHLPGVKIMQRQKDKTELRAEQKAKWPKTLVQT